MREKLPMMIAIRSYAVPFRDYAQHDRGTRSGKKRKTRKGLPRPSDETVVFDTETTTDHAQNLRIGSYQVRKGMTLQDQGIFYEPDNITFQELQLLHAYTHKRDLALCTREEFVRNVLYHHGYDHGGLVLGFNLPFDLSRLATSIYTSHGYDMRGGFSLELLPEKWRPNILVKHLNSKSAFMRFASNSIPTDGRATRKKGIKTEAKRGYFQDAKTLGAALLGRPFTLESLARLLQTKHQKMDTDEHGGPLTPEYLDYAVNDTDVTWECYVELLKQYGAHGLTDTPPHRIYSEASLGKAYLRQMGIERWTKVQPDFSPEMLGSIMSTYYGGRAEVRIRRQMTRVLYCDFRSMYPTVCTLMQLWPFVIAQGIDETDWTEETKALLERVTLRDLQQPNFWKKLTVLVQVHPDEDIFPVRARYPVRASNDEGSRTIGLNYHSAELGLWYTLADCIASKLLTGKTPKIIRAIRFTPERAQSGLSSIAIGGNSEFTIDPKTDDFYKRVIELRGQVQIAKKEAKAAGRDHDADRLGAQEQMLKLLANSTSYGIFAEMNVQSHDRPRDVRCYGVEKTWIDATTKSIEEPGTHFHPLLATLTTGAARLMLAIAERVACDNGIGWALCDTDSLALARPDWMQDEDFLRRAVAVTKWFDPLNPYNDDKPLFKIEEQNFRLENGRPLSVHEPLYAIAISAKRYVLFNLNADNRPVIRKALAHGLGHWLPPYRDREAPTSIPEPVFNLKKNHLQRWHYDVWHQIVLATLEDHPEQVDLSVLPALDKPARSRYSATTSALLHWFDPFNEGKGYRHQVKAFNFLLAYQISRPGLYGAIASGEIDAAFVDDGLPAAVGPYENEPTHAAEKCFDRHTGRAVPVSILASYREAIADYHLHSESKFANGDDMDRGITERRHIQAVAVEYIGKEANRWEEQFYLGEILEAQIEYGMSTLGRKRVLKLVQRAAHKFDQTKLARAAGLSRQQLIEILKRNAKPRIRTFHALLRAVGTLEREHRETQLAHAVMLEKLEAEFSLTSLSAMARRLGQNPSNLRKVLMGGRRPTVEVTRRFLAEQISGSSTESAQK